MSAAAGPLFAGSGHPAVTSRRIHDTATTAAFALAAIGAALAVAIALPKPNLPLTLGVIVMLLFIVWLAVSPKIEWTVTALVIFLGCLNGPTKLVANAGALSSGVQDVLVLAVTLGLIVRTIAKRTPVSMPPLVGWVIAWIVFVLIEAFNPNTVGILKTLAGYRQQLQWVPFFWFGYLLIRTPQRFKRAFWLLGVIALLNAFASTGQTQLSPEEVASLGSGYSARVNGPAARTYGSGGEGHVRPLGLGSDSGFSGGIGMIALPGCLALVALSKRRRERWAALILTLGCLAGVITGLGRLQVGGTIIALGAFVGYSFLAGRRISKPILALLGAVAIALPVGVVFVEAVGSGVFSRYTSIQPERFAGTAGSYKFGEIEAIPKYIAAQPFGFGLGTAGAVSGFGGKQKELFEGHNIPADTEYNFLVKELGIFGLAIWLGFLIRLIVLAATHLRRVVHPELQILLIAIASPLVAAFFMALDGPVSAGVAGGAYFWFAGGVMSYWFLGKGRRLASQPQAAPGTLVAA